MATITKAMNDGHGCARIGEDIENHHCGHPDGHRTQQVSLRVPHLPCDEADVAPGVWFFKDTKGDGKADARRRSLY